MVASGNRRARPKGTSPRLGRIIAGSQAVLAHEDAGPARWVASEPPALHWSQGMVADGQRVAWATGPSRCGLDRAVNAGALAEACDAPGVGVRCRLADPEPASVERWEAPEVDTREEGTRVASGPGHEARTDAPRPGVIVHAAAGTTVVSWGTPQGQDAVEAHEWPGVSRERHARQEPRGTDRSDHGALPTHDGRQTRRGADRQPPRQPAPLAPSLETAHTRVAKPAAALQAPQDQGAASASTGHGQRLEQRRRTVRTGEHACKAATATPAQGAEPAATWGPAGQRAERDGRQPTRRTIRTLWLEHGRRACLGALAATRSTTGRVPQVLRRLCARRGSRLATPSQVLSWVKRAG